MRGPAEASNEGRRWEEVANQGLTPRRKSLRYATQSTG